MAGYHGEARGPCAPHCLRGAPTSPTVSSTCTRSSGRLRTIHKRYSEVSNALNIAHVFCTEFEDEFFVRNEERTPRGSNEKGGGDFEFAHHDGREGHCTSVSRKTYTSVVGRCRCDVGGIAAKPTL